MARVIRKNANQGVADNLAAALNDLKAYTVSSVRTLKADIAGVAAVGTSTPAPGFHDDQSEKISLAANATDLPTTIALANDLKTKFNLHRVVVACHSGGADSTNVVASANATDLATSITLVNEIKTRVNAHMASGPTAKSIRVVAA